MQVHQFRRRRVTIGHASPARRQRHALRHVQVVAGLGQRTGSGAGQRGRGILRRAILPMPHSLPALRGQPRQRVAGIGPRHNQQVDGVVVFVLPDQRQSQRLQFLAQQRQKVVGAVIAQRGAQRIQPSGGQDRVARRIRLPQPVQQFRQRRLPVEGQRFHRARHDRFQREKPRAEISQMSRTMPSR